MIGDDVSHAEFVQHFGRAVIEGDDDPFLLVRGDGARLQVVAAEGMLMLCLARNSRDCQVSFGPTYVDAVKPFQGLSRACAAKHENFVDASFAMQAVEAFYGGQPMSEFVDFRYGCPDPEILTFPEPIAKKRRVERSLIERRIEVPEELRNDMQSVCEFLDEIAGDPDEEIDFDDAIQIGSLCGGRIDARAGVYLFSYHMSSGEVWQFEAPRGVLDAIADGSIRNLTVLASEPN